MKQQNPEKALVLHYIRQVNHAVSISDIKTATDYQVDNRTVQRWLKDAEKQGAIFIVGERKARKYIARNERAQPSFTFLQGLPSSKQYELLVMLRTMWTHNSTALEGNTLNLGETQFVLSEGLTVSGKSLKDHKEVMGHATAIDLLYDMVANELTVDNIKQLHRAVQTEVEFDIDKPYGEFKVVPNGTYLLLSDNSRVYHAYSRPYDVPALVKGLVEYIESCTPMSNDEAVTQYAISHLIFGQIHPFWDGNGRLARLIANLILLRSGYAPLVIPVARRFEYIQILSAYSAAYEAPSQGQPLFHQGEQLQRFIDFCHECYQETVALIEEMRSS